MQTSCGVLLLNEFDEVLVAHATGQRHWDLPKGGREQHESDQEAALRELREETGIVLPAESLKHLGVFDYRPQKRLSLFLARVSKSTVDPSTCRCTSTFRDMNNEEVPEADEFAWVRWLDLPSFCTGRMCAVLNKARDQFVSPA